MPDARQRRALPRLLVLIGSGETAAPMARGHRLIAERLAGPGGRPADVRATVIDTPYAFESNADALTASLAEFFTRRVGLATGVATLPRADASVTALEAAYAQIREADFVFSGPGSPTYALHHWSATEVPQIFAEKLTTGGALVLASAAALTIGRFTVPVYEIYKAGADPYWLSGLDLLSTIGINAVVIPHWNNGEGGGHDTRFCFLGEAKLAALEALLPDDTLILGIEEHTALVVDLDSREATVFGRGSLVVRAGGRSEAFASGAVIPIDQLTTALAGARPTAGSVNRAAGQTPATTADERQLARRVVELEARGTELEARAGMVVPLIETMLEMRRDARQMGAYEAADAIRRRLVELGIDVSDAADGTTSFHIGRD